MNLLETIEISSSRTIKIHADGQVELELRRPKLGEGDKCLSLWLPDTISEALLIVREAGRKSGCDTLGDACEAFFQSMEAYSHAMDNVFTSICAENVQSSLFYLTLLTNVIHEVVKHPYSRSGRPVRH